MSEKECSLHRDKRRKRLRRFCLTLLILIFIIQIIVLLIWATLQPKKPLFVLQDATVYDFNVTAPNFLTSTILVTIASRNPNDKIDVYYDKLDVFAIYQNQQITYYTAIPPTYQRHKEIIVWSPIPPTYREHKEIIVWSTIVSGVKVPVAQYNGVRLNQDQANGTVILSIKIQGRVRFKVGIFISGHYHLSVNCPANIVFGNPTPGIVVGNGIKYQMGRSCSVSLFFFFDGAASPFDHIDHGAPSLTPL